MDALIFHKTLSIDDIKEQQKDSFRIIKRKDEDSYFFRCGKLIGHVSKNVDLSNVDVNKLGVSLVENEKGEFLLLHNIADGNIVMEL